MLQNGKSARIAKTIAISKTIAKTNRRFLDEGSLPSLKGLINADSVMPRCSSNPILQKPMRGAGFTTRHQHRRRDRTADSCSRRRWGV